MSDARERLLDSAAALISARSYAGVGVQELCKHAGVKKGSFYHFFPSKEALTIATLERHWRCMRDEILPHVVEPASPPLQRIVRFVELQGEAQRAVKAESGQTPGCQFGNLAAELSTQSEDVRRKLGEIFEQQAELIQGVLGEAVDAGELAPLDTRAGAEAIQAYVQGLLVMAKVHNDPTLVQRQARRALALVRNASAGRNGS